MTFTYSQTTIIQIWWFTQLKSSSVVLSFLLISTCSFSTIRTTLFEIWHLIQFYIILDLTFILADYLVFQLSKLFLVVEPSLDNQGSTVLDWCLWYLKHGLKLATCPEGIQINYSTTALKEKTLSINID